MTANENDVVDPPETPSRQTDRERRLSEIATEVGDLPVLSHIAMRALELAQLEDWSTAELQDVIVRDHALTARLLRLANSAYFGARSSITTIGRAVNQIGISRTRSALLAAAVEGLHETKRSNFAGNVLWDHALATASISHDVSTACRRENPEHAFMGGLLHDIGRPVMDARFPEQYREAIDLVAAGETDSLRAAERRVFGFDHIDVGYLTAKAWDLPPVILNAILFHHDPDLAPSHQGLCAMVSLANSACVRAGIGPEHEPDLELESLPSVGILGLQPSQLEPLTTLKSRPSSASQP